MYSGIASKSLFRSIRMISCSQVPAVASPKYQTAFDEHIVASGLNSGYEAVVCAQFHWHQSCKMFEDWNVPVFLFF